MMSRPFWLVDALRSLLFPAPDDPLRRRIGIMGGLMGSLTLALLLISLVVEITHVGRDASSVSVRWAVACLLAGGGLTVLSMAPFVLGAHVSHWTGRPRLLFGTCLVLFFVDFALRSFLFFNHVQRRLHGDAGAEGALPALIGEPLASLLVVGLLWGVLHVRT